MISLSTHHHRFYFFFILLNVTKCCIFRTNNSWVFANFTFFKGYLQTRIPSNPKPKILPNLFFWVVSNLRSMRIQIHDSFRTWSGSLRIQSCESLWTQFLSSILFRSFRINNGVSSCLGYWYAFGFEGGVGISCKQPWRRWILRWVTWKGYINSISFLNCLRIRL